MTVWWNKYESEVDNVNINNLRINLNSDSYGESGTHAASYENDTVNILTVYKKKD